MRRDVVVVGASAGGVEALRSIAQRLPPGLEAAVLVVLHIPPGAPSALAQILTRSGPLPAVPAQNGAQLTHARIQVAVADHHMLIRRNRIVLTRDNLVHRHRPAIDVLFRSAAHEYGRRVIGVILSGSQDDGVAGLAAVVEHGGVPVVQDPATAAHASMPSAAIRTMVVEHVLPPAKIGGLLAKLVATEIDGPEIDGPEIDGPEIDGPEIDGPEIDGTVPSQGAASPVPGSEGGRTERQTVRADESDQALDETPRLPGEAG